GPLAEEDHRRVKDLVEEAASALPPIDTPLRARVLAGLTNITWFIDFGRVEELSRQALEAARRTRDPEAMGAALGARLYGVWLESPDERAAIIDEMLRVAAESGR